MPKKLKPTCPAADSVGGETILCGVIRHDRRRESRTSQVESGQGVVIERRTDPSTYANLCCGEYSKCPVWRAEKDRLAAGEKGLNDEAAREEARDLSALDGLG